MPDSKSTSSTGREYPYCTALTAKDVNLVRCDISGRTLNKNERYFMVFLDENRSYNVARSEADSRASARMLVVNRFGD